MSVMALGCTIEGLYDANLLWERIRVVRLVVCHVVLCDVAFLARWRSKARGGGGGVGGSSEASLKWCRV